MPALITIPADDEDEDNWAHVVLPNTEGDPRTVAQAQSCPDWPDWKAAMDREIRSLEEAGTWETVQHPHNRNIVGCKWVLQAKCTVEGALDKRKGHLVAHGFMQVPGIDFHETYSPVAQMASFRSILVIAACHDWEIEAFNFNLAYLNGVLDNDKKIYMEEPPSYETGGDKVKQLCKALYGLKQAGHKWYDALTTALLDLGFQVSSANPGVFTTQAGPELLVLAVHVDDCILTGSLARLINEYKGELNKKYTLTDLGPVHWLLGIKVTQNREEHTISLSQLAYINTILMHFLLTDAKPVNTPMIPGATYSKKNCPCSPQEAACMSKVPYCEAIGSLMYASIATWPDITFAVLILSQFLENPGEAHWAATKQVFRYLSGTQNLAITYGRDRHSLQGYTDADGFSQEPFYAILGHVFLIDGGAVSWSLQKQELVTLSTVEAEYVAVTHAAKEAIWLHRLIGDLHIPTAIATTLFCDNQAALHLAKTDNYHI